ncbi:molybdate ABC transporter permease subunit [Salisediminibacterium halotolerans]|uniref:molybdate ABC transporter permease subunit n=1 Tax=Salisediminibacterium halotolerans TaxID=517425 RepID=UPI000EACBFEE|nr:molybdate ABC transporter permease subunit [Salisediminibacterium halotolerans]RLJ75496.1 molybdate transport system permease protein [Actinophytocola xinjiangensis]RPE89349.1 molybdate transport system permease protein [Salisediminibacterium halotolerans]TWG36109.1 molybdate transport system permease protein [Salisediminibacterium halotolerans]GEL08033.1 molybdenum ABC transporter permease subunit [Salisediminibacterium halotolerans]
MADISLFPLFLSLRVALTATGLAILIGIPIAYYLHKADSRLGTLIDTLITLPIVLPPTVLGYYLLVLLGRNSAIGTFLEDTFGVTLVFTPAAAVVAALVVSIPFMIKSAKTAFASVGEDLLYSAEILGRSKINIFLTLTIPLAWRGIVAGITMTFARALGDFGATLMVAGSIPNETMTMPIAIYDALLAGDREMANVLVAIMTVVALTILYTINRLEKRVIQG